jgi:hypothetical protein
VKGQKTRVKKIFFREPTQEHQKNFFWTLGPFEPSDIFLGFGTLRAQKNFFGPRDPRSPKKFFWTSDPRSSATFFLDLETLGAQKNFFGPRDPRSPKKFFWTSRPSEPKKIFWTSGPSEPKKIFFGPQTLGAQQLFLGTPTDLSGLTSSAFKAASFFPSFFFSFFTLSIGPLGLCLDPKNFLILDDHNFQQSIGERQKRVILKVHSVYKHNMSH